MNPLFRAAREIQDFFGRRGWRFCIVGGLAVVRWGEPRATADVDLTLLAGFGAEEAFVDGILGGFSARIPEARDFALRHRVVLVQAANGVPLDIALGGMPFEEEMVRSASPFEFAPGCSLVTCSAEDLVASKAFADRPRDWADIEGIIARQGGKLDWPRLEKALGPLCELKEAPEIPEKLRKLRRRLGGERRSGRKRS